MDSGDRLQPHREFRNHIHVTSNVTLIEHHKDNPMRKIKVGVIGLGFIGPVHMDALHRLESVEIVAVSDVNIAHAREYAEHFSIPRVFENYHDLLKVPEIEAVHNCTPNHLHFEINKNILEAGKHVVSEKPLATNAADSAELVALAAKTGLVNAVCYIYRYYPLIQHAAMMVKKGALGRIFAVQGSYLQDWLMYDTDWNWRLDSAFAGKSRAVADIGSHCMDLIQFVTGKKIVKVFADMMIVHEQRKQPTKRLETFANPGADVAEFKNVDISTEDYAHILVDFADGAKGMFCVSQVSAGRKNHLTFELNGTRKALWWDQERPNEIHIGARTEPNQLLLKDPALLDPDIRNYAHYPGGHNEGYPTCVQNFCRNVYAHIRDPQHPVDFATFDDGHETNLIIEAILESHKTRQWQEVRH